MKKKGAMKIELLVSTNDEDGQHVAGQIVEFHEAKALEFIEKAWAVKVEEEEEKPEPKKAAVIETPEDNLPERETATLKRGRKRRHQ